MKSEEEQTEKIVGEMNKQSETMPDGKRYIIFYTFGGEVAAPPKEVKENV